MLTKFHRHIIEHSLGISQEGREYRNHYAATKGSDRFADLEHMCELGLMLAGQRDENSRGAMVFFYVTDAGRKALYDA